MVGILTFHFVYNYGALLQAYGLQQYLMEQGIETEIIDYRAIKMSQFYDMSLKHEKFYKVPIKFLRNLKRKTQAKIFDEFVSDKLFCTERQKRECLCEFSKKYSAIIVGSDQVWNTEITGNDESFFLDFCAEETRRIGYAVSIGNPKSLEFLDETIKKYALKFSGLSMRENVGVKKVKELVDLDVCVVCDPVFLLEESKWVALGRKPKSLKQGEFILYYSLKKDHELEEQTYELAKKEEIPIVSIHPMCSKAGISCMNLTDVGPQEFIWLMKNAKYVCSNSFHATAFSCIFEKKALIIPNPKSADRSKQLLNLVRPLQEENVFDFAQCDKSHLLKLIDESKDYLRIE